MECDQIEDDSFYCARPATDPHESFDQPKLLEESPDPTTCGGPLSSASFSGFPESHQDCSIASLPTSRLTQASYPSTAYNFISTHRRVSAFYVNILTR